MSIRKQILLWMVVLTLIPLVIVTVQGLHCARMAVMDMQQDHLKSVLDLRGQQVESLMNERLDALGRLITGEAFEHFLKNPGDDLCCGKVIEAIDQVRMQRPYFEEIALYNKFGKPIAYSSNYVAKFRSEMERHSDTRAMVVQDDAGVRSLLLLPVMLDDVVKAMLHVKMNMDDFPFAIQDSDGHEVCLANAAGYCLVFPRDDETLGQGAMKMPDELMTMPGELVTYRNFAGVPVLGMTGKVGVLDWLLIAETKQHIAFSWINLLVYRAVVTAVITLALALLCALFLAGRLSSPLRALAEVSRKIAAGNIEQRLLEHGDTDSRDVAQSFNQMLDKLEKINRELIHQASLAAVGELSTSIAHEMRNPLATVKMNVSALRSLTGGNPDYQELSELAGRQVERLENMLADLLRFSKPLDFERREFNASELVLETIKLVENENPDKGVKIKFTEPALPVMVSADYDQLQRVLVNLISNAIQFCPPEGCVELSVSNGGKVKFKVIDNGRGLTDDVKARLFRPFFTTRSDGTGLGLAIVKKIVDYHGGTIEAANRGDTSGAVFTVTLPEVG